MRLALSLFGVLLGALPLSAGAAPRTLAAKPKWVFSQRAVGIQERKLRSALEEVFPLSGPVKVRCRGVHPVPAKGGRGFLEIRCTTSWDIDDYLYHLDSHGRVYATRLHKA